MTKITTHTQRMPQCRCRCRWRPASPAAGCRRGSRRATRLRSRGRSRPRRRTQISKAWPDLCCACSLVRGDGDAPAELAREPAPALVRQQPPQRHGAPRVRQAQRTARAAFAQDHTRHSRCATKHVSDAATRASMRTSCSPISSRSKSASCARTTWNASSTSTLEAGEGITGHAPRIVASVATADVVANQRGEEPAPPLGASDRLGTQ